jgi:hypothetical protein
MTELALVKQDGILVELVNTPWTEACGHFSIADGDVQGPAFSAGLTVTPINLPFMFPYALPENVNVPSPV